MRFQDIQLTDKELWGQFQSLCQNGDYASALALLQNIQLSNKALTADVLNAVTSYIVQIEKLNDSGFKQDRILCQAEQPTQNTGEVWLEVTGYIWFIVFLKIFKGVDILASEKNITMKHFNGTDYDTLYPKTIASQIPDVYSKSETYPKSQLYTQSQLYTRSQIDSMMNAINNALDGKARIQTGSYVGTGTYGASNPCSLTFDFIPKLLIFYNITGDVLESRIQILVLLTSSYSLGGVLPKSVLVPVTYYNGTKNENFNTYSKIVNTTIYWYVDFSMPYQGKSAEPAPAQLNQSGTTYRYFVIG